MIGKEKEYGHLTREFRIPCAAFFKYFEIMDYLTSLALSLGVGLRGLRNVQAD